MGCTVQNKIGICFHLDGVVRAVFQSKKCSAIAIRCDCVHEGVIHPTDLKGGVGNPLRGLALVYLDEFQPTHRIVIEPQFLRVIRPNNHCLALGVGVNGVALDALYLSDDQCAGDIGEDNLALGIGPVQAVGGQMAILVCKVGTIRIGDFELDALQRLLGYAVQFVDDQVPQGGILKNKLIWAVLPDNNALRGTI